MNVIVGWIVGNTQSGPHSFRKKKPLGWQYSDGLVTQSYHEAEIARLRAEADGLRAEVEGLRTTLEVIAVGDSRTPHIDAAQALLRSGYWTDEIDAAMGASV